jgi:hypothetical protein
MASSRPILELAGRKIAVDLPHFVFASVIAAWSVWFCRDAWRASPDVENLILIVPVTAVAVTLYFFVCAGCFQFLNAGTETESAREPLGNGMGVKVAGSMVLLVTFVVAGPLIGFDIASFLYLMAVMAFLGERRVVVLLGAPLFFSVVAIYCFGTLLSTPLPLFFSRGEG